MTTMQISDSDRTMLIDAVSNILDRRKQMAPWTLTEDQTEQLYIPMNIWRLKEQIENSYDDGSCFLAHDRVQLMSANDIIEGATVHVGIVASKYLWAARDRKALWLQTSVPQYKEIRAWIAEAVRIQATNDRVRYVFRNVLDTVTTYKQLYKSLPESMAACNAHNNATAAQTRWGVNNNIAKLTAVLEEIAQDGASRARNLSEETLEVLIPNKKLIEGVLAQSVLLSPHMGLERGSTFDSTWLTWSNKS